MRFKNVVVLLAVFFCLIFPVVMHGATTRPGSPAMAAQPATDAFGVPFPVSHSRTAWLAWREEVAGRARARQAAKGHKLDAGVTPAAGSGLIETIAGSSPFQVPTKALQAGLGVPQGLIVDPAGNTFVAVPQFGSVLKIDPASNVTVYAGMPLAAGRVQESGDGGPATAARLLNPYGLALDSSGNLYISDPLASTVREVNAATGIITTIAGNGQYGTSGDGGPATAATLEAPQALTIDAQHNLYIANFDLIRKVNLTTGTISTFMGSGDSTAGCDLSAPHTCAASNVICSMFGPSAIVAAPDGLDVACLEIYSASPTLNDGIISINYQSGSTQLIAGGGSAAGTVAGNSAIGAYFGPFYLDLAIDSAGNLDIAGYYETNGLIQQLPYHGTSLTTIAGNGTAGYSGDGGPATNAEVTNVLGMFVSPQGNLVFDQYFNLRSIDTQGTINTFAGMGRQNYFGDGGPALQAGLGSPSDTCVDARGNLYIADTGNGAIRKVDAVTGMISTIAVPSSENGLSYVYGMAAGNQNTIYLATDDGIGILDTQTGVISSLAIHPDANGDQPGTYMNTGLAFDGVKTLYLNGSIRVGAVDVTTGNYSVIAGSNFGGIETSPFSLFGLALDGAGNLFVSDPIKSKIYEVNLSTGVSQVFAGPSVGGGEGYSGDSGPALGATFAAPEGLRYDGAGHLLIADSENGAIRSIDLSTNIITTVAGSGQGGYTGDGANSASADLNNPYSISFDASGNYFIVDSGNGRIRRVVLHPSPITSTLTSSSTSFSSGTPITLTAGYTGLTYGLAPAGTVTFLDGGTAIGTGTITAGSDGSYTASLNNATLAAGSHSITAQYAGDIDYAANTSTAVALTVTAAAIPPSFTVTAVPATLIVAQGGSGTAVFTVTPAGGFNSAVTFSCGSGLPTGVSCTFAPASVTPTGAAAVTTTLTVTTTAANEAMVVPQVQPDGRWWIPSGVSLACLLLFGVPRRRRRGVWLMVLGFALVAGVGLGCGSGGSGSKGSTPNPDATPVGTYALKLAATGSGASEPVSFTLPVTQ